MSPRFDRPRLALLLLLAVLLGVGMWAYRGVGDELRAELAKVRAASATEIEASPRVEEKPYVGLRALIAGREDEGKPIQ